MGRRKRDFGYLRGNVPDRLPARQEGLIKRHPCFRGATEKLSGRVAAVAA